MKGAFLSLVLAGCSTSSTPPLKSSAQRPIALHLDLRADPPVLTLSATPDDLAQLRARYVSFTLVLGPASNAVQQGFDGALKLPWTMPLRDFKRPYPVRVIGRTQEGTEQVIVEDKF